MLALHLPRGGDAGARLGRAIERRALVRVLAVAQRFGKLAADRAIGWCVVVQRDREPVRDRGIIGAGARIGLGREFLAQRDRCRVVVRDHVDQHSRVVFRFDDDRHVVVVLRRRADHRRPADVDVLDAIVVLGVLRDRRFERIEIDDEKIDRCDAMRAHRGRMFGVVADREQAAVHLGVQRLDAAVHHFGKAGEVGRRPEP